MSNVALGAKAPRTDGKIRISMERAKREATIDRSSTCFRGKGALSKVDLIQSMWLSQEKKEDEYI